MYRIKKDILAALDLASVHWLLGRVLGVFFYKFGKWFARLFISHANQLQRRTAIF